MKKSLMVVAAFGVFGGLILVGTSWSQNPGRPGGFGAGARNLPAGITTGQDVYFSASRDASARSDIAHLMNQLREADDDAKKADLTKQLEGAVAKYFDEDMKARETELTKLEERLTKLRAQLDRRRKAKADIIQLQLKVLVNEADGLGFSGASFFEPRGGVMLGGDWPSGDFRLAPAYPPTVPSPDQP